MCWCACVRVCVCEGNRAGNFVVGLTDVSPEVTAPTLWNYAVCGQYPGAVADGATVSLQCTCGTPAHRYVIVQFPDADMGQVCEFQVFIRSKFSLTEIRPTACTEIWT